MKHLFAGIPSCRKTQAVQQLSDDLLLLFSLQRLSPVRRRKEGVQKKQRQSNGIWEASLEICSFTNLSPTLSFSVPGNCHHVYCLQAAEGFSERGDRVWLESHSGKSVFRVGETSASPPDLCLQWKVLSSLTPHLCLQPLLHCCYFQVTIDLMSPNAACRLGLLQVCASTL